MKRNGLQNENLLKTTWIRTKIDLTTLNIF